VRERVARSRALVARGRKLAVVVRVMQVSRQSIYRTPKRRTDPAQHQFPGYRTPKEVRQTWEDARETEALLNQAA
jgi:hypothetical protein